jgi:integrase
MAKKTGKRRNPVAGLECRAGKWRWRPMIAGKRHTFNLAAGTEAAAIAEVLELRAQPRIFEATAWDDEVAAYVAHERRRGIFSEVNAENRKTALMAIGKALDVSSIRNVTPVMIQLWLEKEIDRTSPGTAVDYLSHLRAFFRYLERLGRVARNPAAEVAAPAVQKRLREVFLPAPRIGRLLELARQKGDRDLEFILALGCECGMRRGEISACRADWFDLPRGLVRVPAVDDNGFQRKGRTGRKREAVIPLSDVMKALIEHHGLPAPYVVAPEKTTKGKNRYRFEFKKRLGNFLKAHGHDDVTIHDLRRSFGSNRVSAGVTIEKVANWMGIDVKTAWRHYARFMPVDDEINRGAAVAAAPAVGEVPVVPTSDIEARLAKIEALRAKGLIREEEAAVKRAEILSEL